MPPTDDLLRLALSHGDGSSIRILLASASHVSSWPCPSPVRPLPSASPVRCLSCAPLADGGMLLLAGCEDGSLLAFPADWSSPGAVRIPLLERAVRALAVAPRTEADGGCCWLAVLHADGSLLALRLSDVAGALASAGPTLGACSGAASVVLPFVRVSLVGARPTAVMAALAPLRTPLFEPTWEAHARCAGGFTLAASGGSSAAPVGLHHVDIESGARSLSELASNAAVALGGAVRGLARDLVGAALPGAVSSGLLRIGGGLMALGSSGAGLIASVGASVGARAGARAGSKGGRDTADDAASAARLAGARAAHARPALRDVALPLGGHALVGLLACPAGRLLLARDGVGRVLLLDGADLTVLRLWKGYRDCQVAWLHEVVEEEAGAGAAVEDPTPHPPVVLLFSRRRRQVEAWPAGPMGERIAVLRISQPEACSLLPVALVRSGGRARCLLITRPALDEAAPVQGETAPDKDVAAAEGAEESADAEAQALAVLAGLASDQPSLRAASAPADGSVGVQAAAGGRVEELQLMWGLDGESSLLLRPVQIV